MRFLVINYGYFRHRFDASNDPKLQSLVDDMGIAALGYYYSLLELYGHHFSNNGNDLQVTIHRRVVANTWRKRVDSCDKVLTKLQLSDLLVYTKCKNSYSIEIPNFLKYYGSYIKKETQNSSNKRKENKIKEKKRNIEKKIAKATDVLSLDTVHKLLPEIEEYALPYAQKMTEKNITTLSEKYTPSCVTSVIHDIANYVEQTGRKYKSYDAVLRKWMSKSDIAQQVVINKKLENFFDEDQ